MPRDGAPEIDSADPEPHGPHEPPEPPPTPRWALLAVVGFVALVVCTNIANIVWPSWSESNPEGLLALSSRNRYLVLAIGGGISPVAYVVVATLRISIAFAVCHAIGRAYRERALGWFTRYLGVTRESLDQLQAGFDKAQLGLVPFFVGSNIVAVMTGVHRTPLGRLVVMVGIGIACRLALFWWLANEFEEPLLDVLSFVRRYQWFAIGISAVLVVLVNVRNFRRGRIG